MNQPTDTTEDMRGGGVAFDARQGRNKLLSEVAFQIGRSQYNHDYESWLSHLRNLYYYCHAYSKTEHAEELKEMIDKAQNILWVKGVNPREIFKKLDELTAKSFLYFKEQFLKASDEGYDDFDLDDALGLK